MRHRKNCAIKVRVSFHGPGSQLHSQLSIKNCQVDYIICQEYVKTSGSQSEMGCLQMFSPCLSEIFLP